MLFSTPDENPIKMIFLEQFKCFLGGALEEIPEMCGDVALDALGFIAFPPTLSHFARDITDHCVEEGNVSHGGVVPFCLSSVESQDKNVVVFIQDRREKANIRILIEDEAIPGRVRKAEDLPEFLSAAAENG